MNLEKRNPGQFVRGCDLFVVLSSNMIDRFGREVVPLSIFNESRPFAARLAFGGTSKGRQTTSLHTKQTSLLPPPVVWRPRPASEQIGSPAWDSKPIDTRPAVSYTHLTLPTILLV